MRKKQLIIATCLMRKLMKSHAP